MKCPECGGEEFVVRVFDYVWSETTIKDGVATYEETERSMEDADGWGGIVCSNDDCQHYMEDDDMSWEESSKLYELQYEAWKKS
jgi:hypothetical protein